MYGAPGVAASGPGDAAWPRVGVRHGRAHMSARLATHGGRGCLHDVLQTVGKTLVYVNLHVFVCLKSLNENY